MNEKKNKASRGRHAAGAAPIQEQSKQTEPATPSAPVVPDETIAMPPTVSSESAAQSSDQGTYRFATEDAFPAPSPLRPVGMGQTVAPARRHKPLKVIGIVFGVLVALLLVAYAGVALYFNGRFMPSATIGSLDVSLMSASDAEKALADSIDDYKLSITGQGFTLNLTASDAGLSIDSGAVVESALSETNPWLWPLELRKEHDGTANLVASYNETGLDDAIRTAVEEFNTTATQPTNAAIVYDDAQDAFVVQPEAVGTALDTNAVIKAADEAIISLVPTLKLADDQLLQPTVLATDPKLIQAAAQANTMITADLVLTMAGSPAAEVNADLISQWVHLGDDLSATLDEAALTAWVDDLAGKCNTVGTERTYTRPDGKVITVAGGPYGWEVDHDALLNTVKEAVSAGSVQTVEMPVVSSGTAYNGVGAQDWGARYCDIDLSEQYARFYDETGALVWESAIVSGTPNGSHNTPTGVFWLNQKASPSKLKGTNLDGSKYESTVQYWMPFDGNVIGLHDADWQSSFGGTRFQDGAGSHGCVNLPPGLAASLYGIIQTGDVVVSHW